MFKIFSCFEKVIANITSNRVITILFSSIQGGDSLSALGNRKRWRGVGGEMKWALLVANNYARISS